jgi:REP element-mobilizing transposase RayT
MTPTAALGQLGFATKYRYDVVTGEHIRYPAGMFAQACQQFGAALVDATGEDDQVHLLIEYRPRVLVSGLVNSLNGVSVRRLATSTGSGATASTCGPLPICILRRCADVDLRQPR